MLSTLRTELLTSRPARHRTGQEQNYSQQRKYTPLQIAHPFSSLLREALQHPEQRGLNLAGFEQKRCISPGLILVAVFNCVLITDENSSSVLQL